MHHQRETPVRYGSRDGSYLANRPVRTCPLCGEPTGSARARYCSDACKQRAYRLRHPMTSADTAALAAELKRRGELAAHTVYECPDCEQRMVGQQRCADCNRFCRTLGPGGACPHCDEPILLRELLAG